MDSIIIFEIDRICRLYYMPGFRPPAIAGHSGQASGDETGHMQSALHKNLSPISMLCAIH
jgi:hypothetical protein